jgi:LPXTG-motif cell wall-anchored protein
MALVLALSTGLLVFPAAASPAIRPAIDVGANFANGTYRSGETVQLVVVVRNTSYEDLSGIKARCEARPNGLRGDVGWGQLAVGLTVPAFASRTFVVSQPLPDGAPRFGYATAENCSLSVPNYSTAVTTTAKAAVPGLRGSGRGRIVQDLNGAALAGASVVVTDPDTGKVVARPVTDDRGGFSVADLPVKTYSIRVPGPWVVNYAARMFGWFHLDVVAGDPLPEQVFAVQPASEKYNNRPNLVVSADFDKPAYNSGDTVRVKVTVSNVGEVAAEGVRARENFHDPMMRYEGNPFGEFNTEPGVLMAPGAVRTFDVVGNIWETGAGVVLFTVVFTGSNGDISYRNNEVRVTAPVATTRSRYAGTIYGDRNANNILDPGEELSRAEIELAGDGDRGVYRQRTDAHGRFDFGEIPTGRYLPLYRIPGGWVHHREYIIVGNADQSNVLIRATRPISETLSASIAFLKNTYASGEVAHLVVTLTNTGSRDLTGITATCRDALSTDNEISSDDPGWGVLAENGTGATVNHGETRTFSVSSVVPEAAFGSGIVVANCRFGIGPFTFPQERVTARAVARVPGGIGTAEGLLVYDRNSDENYEGDGVAHTKLILVDPLTGNTVAGTTTAEDGRYLFQDVPANEYELRVLGPWKVLDGSIAVTHGHTTWTQVHVVPGPLPPDPNASPQPPQPQGGVAPEPQTKRLAKTGANVIGLSIWGISALLIGLALLFVRRRDARQS